MIALARKLAVYVVTAWVAITVNFLLPRLMPGNPIQTMIGKLQGRVTPQTQQAIQLQFGVGLHQSLWSQYLTYWSQLFHGNLGESITLSAPVSTVLGQTLPWTVGLLGVSTVISFALGTLVGIALGWRRGSWLDGLLPVSTFFPAVPYFFLGTVLLLVLGSDLHWFPVLGNYARGLTPGFNGPFIFSVLRYAELPVITIVLSSIAGWMLGMRNMMVTTMDEDFVLVARAKGLPTRRVVSYAARSAILPSVAEDGQLRYDEGLLIGYRGFDRAGTSPRFPFGHGLGYTRSALESARGPGRIVPGDDADITVVVRNTGARAGQQVIQAYVAPSARTDGQF
jgi:peptide/nickel transport system permease protein